MNIVELDRLWQHVPRKIVSAEITTRPSPGVLDQVRWVIVTLDDGRRIELFSFYAHERSFAPANFVGLTGDEARRLKFAPEHRMDWVDS
jgi:hypothetical protein